MCLKGSQKSTEFIDWSIYETHVDMLSAITREKQLKKWNRAWKLELIEEKNPEWKDPWDDIV